MLQGLTFLVFNQDKLKLYRYLNEQYLKIAIYYTFIHVLFITRLLLFLSYIQKNRCKVLRKCLSEILINALLL